MTTRYYSSTSGKMLLQSSVSNSATALIVDVVTGLPGSTPFTVVVDEGTSLEEICDVTGVSGTTLTVTRGVDSSPASAHTAGASVRHMAIARDFRDCNTHLNASTNVHGTAVSSAVVGTTDTQTLTNKTALAASFATSALVAKGAASQTAPILDVQNSAGTPIASVAVEGINMGGSSGSFLSGAGGNLYGFVLKVISSGTGVVGAIFKRFTALQTADILQIQDETGAVLSKFNVLGELTAPRVTSTGPVSGTTGTFTGAVSTAALSATTGAFTGALTGTTGAFSGALSASNFQSAVDAKTTATVGSITTSEVTLVTAPNVTGDTVKKFQISVSWPAAASTTAGDTFEVRIKNGATQLQSARVYVTPANSGVEGKSCFTTDVPAAGVVAYSATAIRVAGAGTGSFSAAATSPIVIVVEQIA